MAGEGTAKGDERGEMKAKVRGKGRKGRGEEQAGGLTTEQSNQPWRATTDGGGGTAGTGDRLRGL